MTPAEYETFERWETFRVTLRVVATLAGMIAAFRKPEVAWPLAAMCTLPWLSELPRAAVVLARTLRTKG